MKKFFAITIVLSMLLAICPLNAFAETTSGKCGENISWSFDKASGTLTISGEGDMYNFEYDRDTEGYTSPWYALRNDITEVIIEYGVTSLGDYAFIGSLNIKSVSICDGLTYVGMYAFSDCDSLLRVSLPNTVTEMGVDVFYRCDKLENVDMPESLDTMDLMIFHDCPSLKSIIVPEGVEWISDNCFDSCTSLTSVTLPDSLTKIGYSAFYACESLESIVIPEGVEFIGFAAFSECKGLISVAIPKSVTEISMDAFWGCDSLTTVIYSGTDENWNAIDIGRYNDALINAYNNKCAHEKTEWNVLDDGTKEKVCTNCGVTLETLTADEFIPNDVNGDNKFNVFDYVSVKTACMYGSDDEALLARADVNGDGKVNMFDYAAVKAAYFAQ